MNKILLINDTSVHEEADTTRRNPFTELPRSIRKVLERLHAEYLEELLNIRTF